MQVGLRRICRLLSVLALPHPLVIAVLLSKPGQFASRSLLGKTKTASWKSLWISYTDFRFRIGTMQSTTPIALIDSLTSPRICLSPICARPHNPTPSKTLPHTKTRLPTRTRLFSRTRLPSTILLLSRTPSLLPLLLANPGLIVLRLLLLPLFQTPHSIDLRVVACSALRLTTSSRSALSPMNTSGLAERL